MTLQYLQTKVALLIEEIRAIKTKQELDSLVLQNLVSAKEATNPNIQDKDDTEFLNQLSKKTQDDKDHLVQVQLLINNNYVI